MPQANSVSEGDASAVASHQAKPIHEERVQREIKYFRDFAAVYSDAIRSSDFKANIALLFLPLLTGGLATSLRREQRIQPSGTARNPSKTSRTRLL